MVCLSVITIPVFLDTNTDPNPTLLLRQWVRTYEYGFSYMPWVPLLILHGTRVRGVNNIDIVIVIQPGMHCNMRPLWICCPQKASKWRPLAQIHARLRPDKSHGTFHMDFHVADEQNPLRMEFIIDKNGFNSGPEWCERYCNQMGMAACCTLSISRDWRIFRFQWTSRRDKRDMIGAFVRPSHQSGPTQFLLCDVFMVYPARMNDGGSSVYIINADLGHVAVRFFICAKHWLTNLCLNNLRSLGWELTGYALPIIDRGDTSYICAGEKYTSKLSKLHLRRWNKYISY